MRAAEEQSGADEQNEARSHLPGDQDSAQPRAAQTLAESRALFLEGGIHIGFRSLQSGSESKCNSRPTGNEQGVGEDANVRADFQSDGAPERRERGSDLDD